MDYEQIWLMDNGSLRPEATLGLRRVAAALSERLGRLVVPVSLLHSSKIDPAKIDDRPAQTFERSLKQVYREGIRSVFIQPLFFGPTRAISEYLPARMEILSQAMPDIRVQVGDVLVPDSDPSPEWLLSLLLDHAEATAASPDEPIILVDHGTPAIEVNRVRNRLAALLDERWLGPVVAASMERRDGAEYDFNEPLLERVFDKHDWKKGPVTVLMLFLLSGRHAGPEGDVAEILDQVVACHPKLQPKMSPLVAENSKLIDGLLERVGPWLSRPNCP
ncbi:MAG: hypothetical protein MK080_13075 [Opitutales bacterium]|nr:hypothetical protein [Opitutales bacterium]NRA28395.1 cobalamin biosynthesis protein CbiX [Opitutales bacterium]